MTEQQLANEVLGWAKRFGWLAFHVRNSGLAGMTQVQGDKGFPDLILLRRDRMIAAELKIGKAGTVKGEPRHEQVVWLNAFRGIGCPDECSPIETYVWRPENLKDIVGILRSQ